MEIKAVAYDHPDAAVLVAGLQRHYVEVTGEEDPRSPDPAEFVPPHGCFFVGYRDGRPVACGGWRTPDSAEFGYREGDAEFKRGYVSPEVNGMAMVQAVYEIFAVIEESASAAGRTRAVLDTGVDQLSVIRYVEHVGFHRVPNYGSYRDDPSTVCYAKALEAR